MSSPTRRVAPLLFGSGLCALVYQVAWLREFRLVFGASTAASAAVLAIFIGGLGIGSLLLGPRADRHPAPLLFYARLETLIAASAALTPLLLALTRSVYVGLGGTEQLGDVGGTLLRLALASLVLAAPTFLMGGTLPAAARAVETEADARRTGVALLYGVNTLGAVAGSFLATFLLLELLGTRHTLWIACALNLLVAVSARAVARGLPAEQDRVEPAGTGADEPALAPAAPASFVLAAAAVVGFAFFLMELVWYRMLGPLLGGSVFTFGLILTLALFGIGIGGALSAALRKDRPATLAGFAWTCALEALCVAAPLALGDRLALLAALLRPLGTFGFWGHVLAWTVVASVVVVPAAIVAGAQFPLLVALLGRGRQAVGVHLGRAYAWNTAGAIAGSLAGGFGLLPLLGAVGAWRAVALLLTLLGLAAVALDLRRGRGALAAAGPAVVALGALALLGAEGPSSAWRHSGIGVGRAAIGALDAPNGIARFLQQEHRALLWEADGVESSVALVSRLGMAFAVNGKIDGHATLDAPTQVMSGLLPVILDGAPQRALVIGLGTGSTAGWLGDVPGVERVDVVELEEAVLEVARQSAAVNRRVLENPRVHVRIGDARETLLTTAGRYDLVFSEPSNPYRAGIASLFTREFYEAVAARLGPDGVFVQWVQAYEVSGDAVRTVYATLGSVFPQIETWRTHRDLLLLASQKPRSHAAAPARQRIASEPFRTALLGSWRVADLEGFLAYFVAQPSLATALRQAYRGSLNLDDRNVLEFGFARDVGRSGLFNVAELLELARGRGEDRPAIDGAVDWGRVDDERLRLYGTSIGTWNVATPEARRRAAALQEYSHGSLAAAVATWQAQPRAAEGPLETALLAEGLASAGDEAALPWIERLRAYQPAEADAALARLRLVEGREADALSALRASFSRHREDPWPRVEVMLRALGTARELALRRPDLAAAVHAELAAPFAARSLHDERQLAAFEIATTAGLLPQCVESTRSLEPWPPWNRDTLGRRLACYTAARDIAAGIARADLARFLAAEPLPIGAGVPAK